VKAIVALAVVVAVLGFVAGCGSARERASTQFTGPTTTVTVASTTTNLTFTTPTSAKFLGVKTGAHVKCAAGPSATAATVSAVVRPPGVGRHSISGGTTGTSTSGGSWAVLAVQHLKDGAVNLSCRTSG
jgi:hypothetical protein